MHTYKIYMQKQHKDKKQPHLYGSSFSCEVPVCLKCEENFTFD